jgi:hypothetical protein
MVECTVNKSKMPPERKVITSRNFKDLNLEVFKSDLSHELRDLVSEGDPNVQAIEYNTRVRRVFDKHCPVQTRFQRAIRCPKWFDDNVRSARRERRKRERRWRKTLNDSDRVKYQEQNKIVNELIVKSKSDHFKSALVDADAKNMYRTLNSLLNSSNRTLPSRISNETLSNNFATYFSEKVSKIRSELDNQCVDSLTNISSCNTCYVSGDFNNVNYVELPDCNVYNNVDVFNSFSPVSETEMCKIISKVPNKTSSLDPMPTWLLKECSDIMTPIIVSLVNNSFMRGCFPAVLREAVVTPLIKKPNLNPDVLKNYRPVSNLPTLGKILEYPAVSRLNDHLQSSNLTEEFQSAYKAAHSTETALVQVKNGILNYLDQGRIILFVLLDMSAAFDTIDHDILVNRFKKEYGIEGCVLSWFNSYLKDRSSRVCISGSYSSVHPLKYGVPQGSVAGPPIFTAYSKPVTEIFKRFNVDYHIYADDTQLYVSYDPKVSGDRDAAQARLTNCIAEVKVWMRQNKLCLNDTKTEFFIISSPWQINSIQRSDLKIGESAIAPSTSIKNLGVHFDSSLKMDLQVSSICRTVNYHLRNISRIRRFIDQNTCAHAVRSLVLSRLDYGNSLLGGISQSNVQRLQKLQNRAARLIYCVDRRTSTSPLLRDLHWLPIQQRIHFKILLHVYNSISKTAPAYLQDLLKIYHPGRAGLRSAHDTMRLVVPATKKGFGDSAFSVMGPKLWNNLPIVIRQSPSVQLFKKSLKTHLFPKN